MSLRLPVTCALVLALGACGANDGKTAKYRLEGSLTQVMDLGYDVVRIQPSVDDVSLLFVRKHPLGSVVLDAGTDMTGESEDYPFKVTAKLWGDAFPVGVRVALTELDQAGTQQRGVASRNVLNDPRKDFPKLRVGTIFFNKALDPGAKIHGDFNVTFENGTEVASGRTVFATFDAEVVQ